MPVTAVAVLTALLALNAVSYGLFGADKRRARRGRRRIPERTLLLSAGVSGTLGAWLAMHRFRHKTRSRAFIARMAAVTAADAVIAVLVVRHLAG
jgi:uncharacterized membrane protein YsdA (DUF1294 family)